MCNKPTKFDENRWSHFWENENFNFFFLCELPLILRVDRKRQKPAVDICKGTLDIEFEWDWSVGLGAMLRDKYKIKNIILVTGIFQGKAESVILLRCECTINPQNLMKIVGVFFFEKIKILNFFVCELPLILKKWDKDICKGTLDIERERDWPVGLGATLGDGEKIKKNYFSSFRDFSGKSRKCHIVGLRMFY